MLADMRPRAVAEQEQPALPGTRRDVVREMIYIVLESALYEERPSGDLLRTTGHSSRQSDEYGLQRYRDEECKAPQKGLSRDRLRRGLPGLGLDRADLYPLRAV